MPKKPSKKKTAPLKKRISRPPERPAGRADSSARTKQKRIPRAAQKGDAKASAAQGAPRTKAQQEQGIAEQKIQALLKRGRERGFVTYSEILYYFPNIEEDILLLEICMCGLKRKT
jgi:hypothetical protein